MRWMKAHFDDNLIFRKENGCKLSPVKFFCHVQSHYLCTFHRINSPKSGPFENLAATKGLKGVETHWIKAIYKVSI